MALSKMLATLMICMVVLSASFEACVEANSDKCFCPCVKNDCMKIKGVTREACADACDKACSQAGYPSRSGPDDFCGF